MPEISRFLGIIIRMYFDDHLPSHFHAAYGDQEAIVVIEGPSILAGTLPPRVIGLILEWATIHRAELAKDWARAQAQQPLEKIEPLA